MPSELAFPRIRFPRESDNNTLRRQTPIERYSGIWVKREDLCTSLADKGIPEMGEAPALAKLRGLWPHIATRKEPVIGVLDTYRSLNGWATAFICRRLGKLCVVFYPVYAKDRGKGRSQRHAFRLGAKLVGLPAKRSVILYHQAAVYIHQRQGYMIPNALKISESVTQTAAETLRTKTKHFDTIVVPMGTGTIAAGVILGLRLKGEYPSIFLYMGYSRPPEAVRKYLLSFHGVTLEKVKLVDEGFSYRKSSHPKNQTKPPFPASPFYERGCWNWIHQQGREKKLGKILLWNVGV